MNPDRASLRNRDLSFLTQQELEDRIKHLEKENKQLKENASEKSWEGYVDRQSGAFSQDEIDNATAWR